MHVGHHAARAAATDTLEKRERRFHNAGVSLDNLPLVVTQRKTGRRRYSEDPTAIFTLKLKNVAGEMLEFLLVDRENFPARAFQSLKDHLAFGGVNQRVRTNDSQAIADAHHHVGVLDLL